MSGLARIRRPAIHALALVLALALPAAQPAEAQRPLRDLDRFVQRVMDDWDAPGVAVAVVKDDRVVLAKGYGVKEVGGSDPITANSLFAIASTSKAFTAAALGMLVDEGKISWDDHVTDLLPGFQMYDPYVTRELTVRDLLSHRGGLPRGDRLWYASPFDRDEVIRRVRYLEPAWSFRSHYGYQNIMFLTAGEIVPAVTDTSWDDFVRARIFTPLGMTTTTTTVRDLPSRTDVATPHGKIDGEVVPIGWRNFDNLGGAGTIISSVSEMAQWIRLQLGHGVYNGTRLLSDSVMREMHQPQTIIPRSEDADEMFPMTHFSSYGMGWSLQDYRGRKVVRHGGSLDGMRTHVGLLPEENLGVVVITNVSESAVPQIIMWHIFDAYLGAREPDWEAVYLADAAESEERAEERRQEVEDAHVEGTSPSLALEDYVGTYTDRLYGDAVVRMEDGHLVLEVGPSYVGDLEHWHYDTFRAVWRDRYLGRAFVTFQLDERGRVASVEVDGWDTFMRRHEE